MREETRGVRKERAPGSDEALSGGRKKRRGGQSHKPHHRKQKLSAARTSTAKPRISVGRHAAELYSAFTSSVQVTLPGGKADPMRRVRLFRRKMKSRGWAAANHPRLLIERTDCGPPSPLPATLASPTATAIAFCKSFTFLSRQPSGVARILARGEDEPVRWARPLSRTHGAATWGAS
jgi:hypothetical protein